MKKQFWLWLLLLLLSSPKMTAAQNGDSPPAKESHRFLGGGFDQLSAQEMMAERLQELHHLHQLLDQVQDMLKDVQSGKSKEELLHGDLQGQLEKILQGNGLSQQKIDKLRDWMAKHVRKDVPPNESRRIIGDDADDPSSPPSSLLPTPSVPASVPPPSEPARSLLDRLQEKTTKWLIDNLEDVSGELLQALTDMEANTPNTPLAEMLRSVSRSDFTGINIRNHPLVPALRSGTLSRYLSNAGDFLHRQSGVWDKVGSLFHKSPLPSLVGGPSVSLPTPAAAESDGSLPALLSMLMLGVIVLLICKNGFGAKTPNGPGKDAEWRLGPWPVLPSAVSTRQDMIRAFEYLVLLRLGPAAAACHHRQLAELLAELPPHSPCSGGGEGGAGRRLAAEMLAWLYEQARYAPADATLSPEQLSDARHALCSLAGVTTA